MRVVLLAALCASASAAVNPLMENFAQLQEMMAAARGLACTPGTSITELLQDATTPLAADIASISMCAGAIDSNLMTDLLGVVAAVSSPDSDGHCSVLQEDLCYTDAPSDGNSQHAALMAVGLDPVLVGLPAIDDAGKAAVCEAVKADSYTNCAATMPVAKVLAAYVSGPDACKSVRDLIDEYFASTLTKGEAGKSLGLSEPFLGDDVTMKQVTGYKDALYSMSYPPVNSVESLVGALAGYVDDFLGTCDGVGVPLTDLAAGAWDEKPNVETVAVELASFKTLSVTEGGGPPPKPPACPDSDPTTWPEVAAPLIPMGGCDLIPQAAGLGLTCTTDLATNPTVQTMAPGFEGTLCDWCPNSCGGPEVCVGCDETAAPSPPPTTATPSEAPTVAPTANPTTALFHTAKTCIYQNCQSGMDACMQDTACTATAAKIWDGNQPSLEELNNKQVGDLWECLCDSCGADLEAVCNVNSFMLSGSGRLEQGVLASAIAIVVTLIVRRFA